MQGPNYLTDKVKTRAEKSLMHLVGFDCVAHDQEAPISHIASHPANFVKKAAQSELNTKGDLAPFFFIVNFQASKSNPRLILSLVFRRSSNPDPACT